MPWSVPTTAALLFTLGSIAQLPCGTPSGPSLRSGIASDGGFSVQRAFVDHVGEARILPHSGLEGALRLRGGVSGKHRTKKTKDPAEMGVVPLADSMTNGWYSRQVNMRENMGPWVNDEEVEEYDAMQAGQQPGFGKVAPEGLSGTGGHEDYEVQEITPLELACQAFTGGNHSLAVELFQALLVTEPNDTIVLNNYATMLIHNETELDKAEELLIRALELEPDYADAMTNLALILAASGRVDEAEAKYTAVLLDNPDDLPALTNYAHFLQEHRQNYTGAYELLVLADRCSQTGGDISTLANLISLLCNHMPEERFIQDDPEIPGHYNLTGLGLARRLMFRCLDLDPSHPWVQDQAPILLSKDHPSYAEYRGTLGQFRPSDFEMVDGEADLICRPDEPPALGAILPEDLGAIPAGDGPASEPGEEPIVWKRPQPPRK